MNKYCIDLKGIKSRTELHFLLKNVLSLPDYYGNNLDALHDCLTDISSEATIEIKNIDKYGAGFFGRLFKTTHFIEEQEYAGKLMLCFDHAADESEGSLKVIYL